MYGTIARLRARPGVELQLQALASDPEELSIPGFVAQYIDRMDTDSNEYWLTVVFEDKESYVKNAESAEQDARYRKFRALLEADPEWHDGEIVLANGPGVAQATTAASGQANAPRGTAGS